MSCVLRGHSQRTDPSLVFAAVKRMAPSSREATGPEAPDESPPSPPSPRGTMVQKSPTHAGEFFSEFGQVSVASWVSLVSANVPRMRLCSSLFVVEHTSYNSEGNAECATNEVVQFFVYCKKYIFQ